MTMKNPLDVLFRDLQRELDATQKAQEVKKKAEPKQSTYANPLNWRPGRVIELIHQTDGSLGMFQEYFHKLSPTARRLLPAAAGLAAQSSELVFGEFWLHPKYSAQPINDSEAEIQSIIARFNELMDEWAEDA